MTNHSVALVKLIPKCFFTFWINWEACSKNKSLGEWVEGPPWSSRSYPVPSSWSMYRMAITSNNVVEGWHNGLHRRASDRWHEPTTCPRALVKQKQSHQQYPLLRKYRGIDRVDLITPHCPCKWSSRSFGGMPVWQAATVKIQSRVFFLSKSDMAISHKLVDASRCADLEFDFREGNLVKPVTFHFNFFFEVDANRHGVF